MKLEDYLWNDLDFVEKRVKEQLAYLEELDKKNLSEERKQELRGSASFVLDRFQERQGQLRFFKAMDDYDEAVT